MTSTYMNRIRTVAAAALSLGLAVSAAHALEGEISVDAEMRIGPDGSFPIVGVVPGDTAVSVNGCTGAEGWCVVRFDGRHGWVSASSIVITGFSRNRVNFDDAIIVIDVSDRTRVPDASDIVPFVVERETLRGNRVIRID